MGGGGRGGGLEEMGRGEEMTKCDRFGDALNLSPKF